MVEAVRCLVTASKTTRPDMWSQSLQLAVRKRFAIWATDERRPRSAFWVQEARKMRSARREMEPRAIGAGQEGEAHGVGDGGTEAVANHKGADRGLVNGGSEAPGSNESMRGTAARRSIIR